MPVKEILVVDEIVVRDQSHDLGVGGRAGQAAQAGTRHLFKHLPHNLVSAVYTS